MSNLVTRWLKPVKQWLDEKRERVKKSRAKKSRVKKRTPVKLNQVRPRRTKQPLRPHMVGGAAVFVVLLLLFLWSPDEDGSTPAPEPQSTRIPIVLDGESEDIADPEGSIEISRSFQTEETVPEALKAVFEPPVSTTTQNTASHLSDDQRLATASLTRGCRLVPETRSALNKWLNDAYANDELSERIEWVRSAFDKCQGVDRSFNYIESFKSLAEQGHEKALWNFWNVTDAEVFRLQNIHKHERDAIIAARQQFNVDKYKLAEQQVLRGSERAMMRLMYSYQHLDPIFSHDGQGQNYIRSLAMANLTMKMTEDQDNYRRAQWHKERLEQRMQPKEIEIAMELSQQLFAQIAN